MKTKTLLVCGMLSAPVFVATFFTEGATRPGYNWLRQPVSSLSIGALAWIQIANFIITGALIVALAFGLRRSFEPSAKGSVWGPLLVGLVGLGQIGAGVFVTDPVYGYPADAPLTLAPFSLHAHLHVLFAMFVFVGLPAACFVLVRRFLSLGERGWALYSLLSGLGMPVALVLAVIGFNQTPGFVDYAGAFQRLSITIGLSWLMLIAIHQFKLHSQAANKS